MVTAKDVSKDFFGIPAVNRISFEVQKGDTMVLLGTSGCGKTTTLKMLNRLISSTSGDIFINGQNINTVRPDMLRRSIGYISQNNGLFPHFNVAENIAIVPKLLGWNSQAIKNRSEELLNQLKLPPAEFCGKYPDQLSGGQKQRVALARALVSDPPVLLMDEPFGALDPITRAGIRKEFRDLPELQDKTIILVTHDVQEAFELADQICLMDQGKIVQTGTPEELIFSPDHAFTKAFFEHQRLQLELGSLKLKRIWHYLSNQAPGTAPLIDDSQSIWNAMQQLAENNLDHATAVSTENSTLKMISLPDLQAAYMQFKRQL